MSWSYDLNLTEPKDQVRLLVRDTDEGAQLLQDEEINFLLGQEGGDLNLAAGAACRCIAETLIRKASIISKDSGLKDDMKEKADVYLERAREFEGKAGRTGLTVFAGGISTADKTSRAEDADATAPAFRKDLHQSPAVSVLPGAFPHS